MDRIRSNIGLKSNIKNSSFILIRLQNKIKFAIR